MANLNSSLVTGTPNYPSGALCKGALVAQRATVALGTSGTGTNLNDTITMLTLPRGATPVEMYLEADQLDSNGAPTLTLDLGTAASPQAYLAAYAGASAASSAAGLVNVGRVNPGALAQVTVDTTLIVTIHAAAATKKAGNLSVLVTYTIDGLPD